MQGAHRLWNSETKEEVFNSDEEDKIDEIYPVRSSKEIKKKNRKQTSNLRSLNNSKFSEIFQIEKAEELSSLSDLNHQSSDTGIEDGSTLKNSSPEIEIMTLAQLKKRKIKDNNMLNKNYNNNKTSIIKQSTFHLLITILILLDPKKIGLPRIIGGGQLGMEQEKLLKIDLKENDTICAIFSITGLALAFIEVKFSKI